MRRIFAGTASAVVVLGAGSAAARRPPTLAFVWNSSVVSLTRVDPMSLRPSGGPSLPIGTGAFFVTRSPRGGPLAFDTERGAVLSLLPLHETLFASTAVGGRVVFLLATPQTIGPVRLGVAGIDGTVRTVLLGRLSGGTELPPDVATGVVTVASPALAVEPTGRRAAVVGAAGLVAEVDLDSLAVT
jgi:hypothetical protein